MAPELFEYGAKRPTTAVDMFSYGVLMWCGPAAPGMSVGAHAASPVLFVSASAP